MRTSNPRPKIGLLALTLELYETLAPGLRRSREDWLRRQVIPALARNHDVLFERAVCKREEAQVEVQKYELAGADVILVMLLTYSPSQLVLPALQSVRLPIVLWNTQELYAVDAQFSQDQMIDNHGVHGTQDLANALTRCAIPFHYVTSHLQAPDALHDLEAFFKAAAVVHRLRQSRIGLLGYPFPGMGDFAVDTTHMISTLGCAWTILTVEEYLNQSLRAGIKEVKKLVREYRNTYAVAPDVTEPDLAVTARAELALRKMVSDHQLAALTYQFLAFGDDERTSTLPFVAASRLMAEGLGFGGEGDLIAAVGNSILNWLQPPASFTEMFTMDFAGQSVFMSHMGEANVAMARTDRKIALVARSSPITRTRDRQLCLVTSFQPGPATFVALAQGLTQRWRFIVASVNIEDFGPLPSFCVPHFKMKPTGDVGEFLTAYAQAGGPHHAAICFGDARNKLRHTARLLGADYLEI